MTTFRDRVFDAAQQVLVDGHTFEGCVFHGALVFQGGIRPQFRQCRFERESRWVLNGSALAVGQLLAQLYHFGGDGGRELVERFFDEIRDGGSWLDPAA